MRCCGCRLVFGAPACGRPTIGERMLRVSGAVREPVQSAWAGLRGRGLIRAFAVFASLTMLLVCATGAVGSTAKAKKKKAAPPTRAITEFPITAGISRPGQIVVGPGGNLWFTQSHTNAIGRITP